MLPTPATKSRNASCLIVATLDGALAADDDVAAVLLLLGHLRLCWEATSSAGHGPEETWNPTGLWRYVSRSFQTSFLRAR